MRSETRPEELRLLEALLFAASEPLDEKTSGEAFAGRRRPARESQAAAGRIRAARRQSRPLGNRWTFRTANDLAWLLTHEAVEPKKLSRAAIETLAIIAYHQPVTRAEIEDIRGVSAAKGTLDVLLETGWIRPRGRRKAPGRPLTYGTTAEFLVAFRAGGAWRPAGARRPQGLGPVRWYPAGRLRSPGTVGRSDTARRTRTRWSPAISTSALHHGSRAPKVPRVVVPRAAGSDRPYCG